MNNSGIPLSRIVAFYKIETSQVLVINDDLDLPFGRLRLRASGTSGGHNGLGSIIDYLGEGFPRLKIGIGRGYDPIAHVLSQFEPAERADLPKIIAAAADGAVTWLESGVEPAANAVNGWQLYADEAGGEALAE